MHEVNFLWFKPPSSPDYYILEIVVGMVRKYASLFELEYDIIL